jgi:hypothetical protein
LNPRRSGWLFGARSLLPPYPKAAFLFDAGGRARLALAHLPGA